ncbi:MOSC domain-containing protein [Brevibacterium litoralis]|uniref:MOSC domain-containing protein n=1 Tax=Brevibacterium litoralis TaxID=3138935 RepID=UPI0032EE6D8D
MSSPAVTSLHRFPVKGFPAEALSRAHVDAGSGIRGDRAFAFANGSVPVVDGQWARCGSFSALKNDTTLQRWSVTSLGADGEPESGCTDPTGVLLTAPDDTEVRLDRTDQGSWEGASAALADLLAARGEHPRRVVSADQGMFDGQLSGLSFHNPATIALLERWTGQEIDPLRFRGNVVLSGLAPFEEYALLGAVVRIGGVVVGIRKSSERCPATRVDPRTADPTLNVPRMLARGFGHVHMGVDGHVLDGGEIGIGDEVQILAAPGARAWESGSGSPWAGRFDCDPRDTPRLARVLGVTPAEADGATVEVALEDPLGWFGHHFRPGQHMRVHLVDEDGDGAAQDEGSMPSSLPTPLALPTPLWRSYTVVDADPEHHRFTFRIRLDGRGSRLLAGLAAGSPVLVSGPFGAVTDREVSADATVLVTGGSGISAAMALVRGWLGRALADAGSTDASATAVRSEARRFGGESVDEAAGVAVHLPRSLHVVHVERATTPTRGWERLAADLAALAAVSDVRVTHRRIATQTEGRPDHARWARELAGASAASRALLVCGPDALMDTVTAVARDAGWDSRSVHREAFSSPDVDVDALIADTPPARVTAPGIDFTWEPSDGTLLEALEGHGATPPASCRAGSCGTCVLPLRTGAVTYPLEPSAPHDADHVVTCSAVPAGPVELGTPE